jgi:hypothetical protein
MEGYIRWEEEIYHWRYNTERCYFSLLNLDDSLLFAVKIRKGASNFSPIERIAIKILENRPGQ